MERQIFGDPNFVNDKVRHFVENDMMAKPIAYILGKECLKKKVNDELLYIPPVRPDSTFYTVDCGFGLAKGSKLRPYLDFV